VTFRAVLQAELDRRRSVNRRYSLRAFARSLATDHSTLSQILRGRRRLTARGVRTLGAALKLSRRELDEHEALEHEAAILDAVGRPEFRPDSRWLATITGIRVDAVNTTLQRLLRKRRLVMASRDRWRREEEVKGG
jgi:DNA-binding transcriptional regulator YdaS (Cro superfamily)